MNFLALLGWAPDGETTIMSPDELVERFTLDRVGSSPATFDYEKLDWMNGVYLRALPPEDYADEADRLPARAGDRLARASASAPRRRSSRRRSSGWGSSPSSLAFCLNGRDRPESPFPDRLRRRGARPGCARGRRRHARRGRAVHRGGDRGGAAGLADRLGQKPRQAFQPIRIAVTGSKVSPGLFESIELLGREETLVRIRSAHAAAA